MRGLARSAHLRAGRLGRIAQKEIMTKQQQSEREQAIAQLRETLKPGMTVYTQLQHVSRSGMSRVIQVVVIEDHQPRCWGFLAAKALDWSYDNKREGIKVSGCGMNMGFHVVYSLSGVLFPGGFKCNGKDCPSNDHFNGDRNYKPHHHTDGGYALNQRWL